MLYALKDALNNGSNDLLITALYMQITDYLCRCYQDTSQNNAIRRNPYTRLIDYIDKNFTSTITLEELSHHSGLSKNGIIAIFKRLYHTTPIQYINTLRIYHAEQLLRSTDLSITQIAMVCGFNDFNYFSRIFRAIRGTTPPRKFRRSSRSLS